MTDETEAGTGKAPKGSAPRSAAEQRAERLKAALRDNLRRRKAQMRGRSSTAEADATPEADSQT